MIRYPAWLEKMEGVAQEQAKVRFLMRVYALYASEEGTVTEFAKVLNLTMTQIRTQTQSQFWRPLPVETAIRIENALGRDIAPRELLRPDVFQLPEAVSK
jgi:hypothetical protein